MENPVYDWRNILPADIQLDGTEKYIGFGWGDRLFFPQTPSWSDIKPGLAIRALLIPTKTVMHISLYENTSLQFLKKQNSVVKISLNRSQYRNLLQSVLKSLQLNSSYRMFYYTNGYSLNDFFVYSKGYYSVFYHCNSWTADKLQSAGIALNGMPICFSKDIMKKLGKIRHVHKN